MPYVNWEIGRSMFAPTLDLVISLVEWSQHFAPLPQLSARVFPRLARAA